MAHPALTRKYALDRAVAACVKLARVADPNGYLSRQLRLNVCGCPAHPWAHQRSVGACRQSRRLK